MTEERQGYIKSRFSPLNIGDWYHGSLKSQNSTEDSMIIGSAFIDGPITSSIGLEPEESIDSETEGELSEGELSEASGFSEDEKNYAFYRDLYAENGTLPEQKTLPKTITLIKTSIIHTKMAAKKGRSTDWRTLILKRYRRCAITGLDTIECDAAHIVPFKECTGSKEAWAADKGNGLLLSKNLHWTFDRFYWSLDPNDILKEDESHAWLRIVIRNTKRRLSIVEYCKPHDKNEKMGPTESPMLVDLTEDSQIHGNIDKNSETYGYVRVYKDNIPFLRIHYESFLAVYNLKKGKSHSSSRVELNKQVNATVDHDIPVCRIIKRKFDNSRYEYLYQCITTGLAFNSGKWLTEKDGINTFGSIFSTIVSEFNDKMEEFEDPAWEPRPI